jgi:hypothetical protein
MTTDAITAGSSVGLADHAVVSAIIIGGGAMWLSRHIL